MINQLLLVGKIKKVPDMDLLKNNGEIEVEVKRSYKNNDGIYLNDCFKCYLWIAISKKISISCKVGDVVAIKGRLIEDEGSYKIMAEQVVLIN